MIEQKKCSKCGEVKGVSEFHKKLKSFASICKVCVNADKKQYWIENKNILSLKKKEYYKNNREKITLSQKEWREKNKDYLKEKHKRYRQNNREKINELVRNNHNKRKLEDKMYLAKRRARSLIRNAFKSNNITKGSKTEFVLGCDFKTFKKHIERQFIKGMRWDNQGKWHIDHIIPLATAKTEEDVIRLNHYTNLQPLWAEDNLSKGAKIL